MCTFLRALNAGLAALRLFRGSGPVLLRNPFIFVIFQGGGGGGGPDSDLRLCAGWVRITMRVWPGYIVISE